MTKERRLGIRCDDSELLELLWDRTGRYASCWSPIMLVTRLDLLPDLLYMESLERLLVDAYDTSELSVLDFVAAPRLRRVALRLFLRQTVKRISAPCSIAPSAHFARYHHRSRAQPKERYSTIEEALCVYHVIISNRTFP